jgi:DNA-binding LytR/AlgR family response regulator
MIRCLAIDDSPLALDLLQDYISRIHQLELVQQCSSALEALPLIRKGNIDLLFLDIEMPDISGIQLIGSLDKKPKIIFTTAYSNYALEGFNLEVTDYLLKPFSFDRFKKAADKAIKQITLEQTTKNEDEILSIRSGYETHRVNIGEIRYVEALKDYVQLYVADKKILVLMSMKEILEMLPKEQFIRIHRSFIISLKHISSYSSRKVIIGQKEIPVGESYRDHFLKIVNEVK